MAAVDSGGWPAHVATDELIESAWGNAVVDALRYPPIGMGVARVVPHVQAAIGNVLSVTVVPMVNYATRMMVNATVWAGSDSTTLASVTGAINNNVGGASQPVTPPAATTAGGGQYASQPLVWSWIVPANVDPSYAVHAQWGSGGGTIYTAADTIWQRFRA